MPVTPAGGHCVAEWFGDAYAMLHPRLRDLHGDGGVLSGPVEIVYGRGIAHAIGRRLARRLGVPAAGASTLHVTIRSSDAGLHWHRRFGDGSEFRSLFVPVGRHPHGWWRERSGALELRLQVDVRDGAWHWRHVGTRWHGVPLPRAVLPTTIASKACVDDGYRFSVEIRVPVLGMVLMYRGTLSGAANAGAASAAT